MGFGGIKIGLALALVLVMALMLHGSEAQSGCTKALMSLIPCLNYVSGNSSTPSSSCCSQLSNVVQTQPECLCLLLNGTASSYGYSINQTLALALPGACNVQTPPASLCNAISPSSPPSCSPTDDTPTTIPSGSKTDPATSGRTSDRSSKLKFSSYCLAITLIFTSYFSNFLNL